MEVGTIIIIITISRQANCSSESLDETPNAPQQNEVDLGFEPMSV